MSRFIITHIDVRFVALPTKNGVPNLRRLFEPRLDGVIGSTTEEVPVYLFDQTAAGTR